VRSAEVVGCELAFLNREVELAFLNREVGNLVGSQLNVE